MKSDEDFRTKAELKLAAQLEKNDPLDGRELNEVIQELRIHQIELEMQNEALREAQLKLETSRNSYRELYEFAPAGIFTCDLDGEIIAANATVGSLLGVPRADLLRTSFARFSTQSCKDSYYHHAKAVLASGSEKSCTISLIRQDGRAVLADMKSNIETVSGKTCIRSSLLDITDRAYIESLLHLTSTAIEKAAEGILITDAAGIILNVNTAFSTITGYAPHEVIGKNPTILNSGKHDASFYETMWQQLGETGQWQGAIWNRKKNGEIYPENLSISAICNAEDELTNYIGLFSDISEKISLEEQLRQAQKMEAVGTLVGGIAHDFNNMLAGITGNLYLANKLAEDNPELSTKLNNIEQLSNRAAQMISQMLTFARKGIVQMQTLSLSSFTKEAIKLSRVSVPENIIFHYTIESDDLLIQGDVTQLQQVIMNLLNNARDALASTEEPEIELSLKIFHADQAFRTRHPDMCMNQLVQLSVRDNGCGIEAQNIEHIFDPFYTSKDVGEGTGLGLSMCFGAVQSHDGVIEVESTVGKGSTFHVYLPLLEDKALDNRVAVSDDDWQAHGETILIADDEQCVRESIAEVLTDIGYHVLQAPDGKKALEIFAAHKGEIQLAILDIVMPYLGGPKLAEKLRLTHPNLPILFATGYDKEHVLNSSASVSNSEVITKPFKFDELGQIIRKLMAG